MDFCNTDPMFGSAVFQDVISSHQGTLQSSRSMGVMDFDSYSRPTMVDPHDIEMDVDSPTSESYCESDDATSIMGFQDSVASPGDIEEDTKLVPKCEDYSDSKFLADRNLIYQRWGPFDVFPADKTWTLEQKAAKLIELSPCNKYSLSDIINIDQIESPETRVDILIELVSKITVNFRWNYVRPHELFKSYTVVTNCKKEKEKKDAEGNPIPKRPMNAFMIWCQKCRTLMSHICPQLHNAIISKALGATWKTFTAEERAVYEEEKIKLMAFHQHEFPDYKYRPKKKPKKSEEKTAPAPKSRSKKKSAEKPQPAPLRGINIADEARQNLDPLLKERLQVKMQVKIDPDLKRGIGKRATAIDLADLTGFQADFASSSPEGAHQFLENQTSSVFDTPENSPHEPRTPSDLEQSAVFPKEGAFRFDEKLSLNLDNNNSTTTTNNNVLPCLDNNVHMDIKPDVSEVDTFWPALGVKPEPVDFIKSDYQDSINLNIKSEPLDYIKSEPLDYHPSLWNNNNSIKIDLKPEPKMEAAGMPVLSVEYVESVLEDELNDYESPDMQDLMRFITSPDVGFPSEPSPFIMENTMVV